MPKNEKTTQTSALAEEAAHILGECREGLLRSWLETLRELVAARGLEGMFGPAELEGEAGDVFEHLIGRLNGRLADSRFAAFHRWAYEGRNYGVQLADVHRVLVAFRQSALQAVAGRAEDPAGAAGMAARVAAALDLLMARTIEMYEASREAEFLTVRERLSSIIGTWQVAESIAGVESTRDLFGIARSRLGDAFDLAGCIVRLYASSGEKEKDLRSSPEVPVPLARVRSQYVSSEQQSLGGVLDVMEMCRRTQEPFFWEAAPEQDAPPQPPSAPVAKEAIVNKAELLAAGIHGVAAVPMTAAGQLVGVLVLLLSSPGGIQAGETKLLRDLADVLAPAFARASGIERSLRQVTEAEVIAGIGRSLLEMPTLEGLLEAVVEAMQKFRHYGLVALWRLDEQAAECVLMAAAGPKAGSRTRGQRLRLGEGLVGTCAARGEPEAGDRRAGPATAAGAPAELAVPVIQTDRVIGVVELASTAEDAFAKAEVTALMNLSTHVGIALQKAVMLQERRRAEAALVQERDVLNLVVDAMGAGLALFDGERRLQWANSTWMEWFGLDAGAFGRTCEETRICNEEMAGSCPLREVIQAGAPLTDLVERIGEDGQWRCYMRVITPVEHGQTRLLLLMTDITEQSRHTEHLRLVNRLGQALEGSLDLERVLHVVLTFATAGHAIGFNRAFLFLLEPEGQLAGSMAVGPSSAQEAARIWHEIIEESRTLEDLVAVGGPSPSDEALSERVRAFSVPIDESRDVLATSLRERRTILVRSAREQGGVDSALARGLELEEFVCVPLFARDQPLGVMLADNKFSRIPIDEEQVELLRTFSAQASLAIANARAYRKISAQMEEIQKTHQELLEAERFAGVGRMAAHLAHEIRNPLSAIGGFAHAIQASQTADESVSRRARVIYEEALRLESTLANVLELARPIRPEMQLADLNALISETIREFANDLRAGRIKLRYELTPGIPHVMLDRNLIKQVLINLLKNAVQALENAEKRTILVASALHSGRVSFCVADNGCGMNEETRKTLFAPFFTTKVGGSGLGLSVSRKIVAEHDGEIRVESELGKGSTFRVVLPLPQSEGGE